MRAVLRSTWYIVRAFQPCSTSRRPPSRRIESPAPRLDLQQHLADLEAAGLLMRIDRPINKDTELDPTGALAVHRRHAGGRAPRLPVHQRDRLQGPQIRHAGGGRRARVVAGDLRARHGPRRSRRSAMPGWQAIAHPIPPVAHQRRAAARRSSSPATRCASEGAEAPAGAGVDAGLRCRALSHRDALRHQGSGNRRAELRHLPGRR